MYVPCLPIFRVTSTFQSGGRVAVAAEKMKILSR
jgi:hypothetical protein